MKCPYCKHVIAVPDYNGMSLQDIPLLILYCPTCKGILSIVPVTT
jgi:uncharacterized protein YbaR (Trm112 family)